MCQTQLTRKRNAPSRRLYGTDVNLGPAAYANASSIMQHACRAPHLSGDELSSFAGQNTADKFPSAIIISHGRLAGRCASAACARKSPAATGGVGREGLVFSASVAGIRNHQRRPAAAGVKGCVIGASEMILNNSSASTCAAGGKA